MKILQLIYLIISYLFIISCGNKKPNNNQIKIKRADTVASTIKNYIGKYDDVKRDSIRVYFNTGTKNREGDTLNVFIDNRLVFSDNILCRYTSEGWECVKSSSFDNLNYEVFLRKLNYSDFASFFINKQNFKNESKMFVKLNDSIVFSIPLSKKYDRIELTYADSGMQAKAYKWFRRYDTLRYQDKKFNKIIDYDKLTKLNNISRNVSNEEFLNYLYNNPAVFMSKEKYDYFAKGYHKYKEGTNR